jgi:hypothetical protein
MYSVLSDFLSSVFTILSSEISPSLSDAPFSNLHDEQLSHSFSAVLLQQDSSAGISHGFCSSAQHDFGVSAFSGWQMQLCKSLPTSTILKLTSKNKTITVLKLQYLDFMDFTIYKNV